MNTLPSRIHDSQNGLNYTLVGDYYLPDLEIENSQPVGKYGRARMKVLKEHCPGVYSRLLLSGKLYDDLREVDAEAQRLLDEMIPKMAAEAGVDEGLKAADPMRWVRMANAIKAQVEETIWNISICIRNASLSGRMPDSAIHASSFQQTASGRSAHRG